MYRLIKNISFSVLIFTLSNCGGSGGGGGGGSASNSPQNQSSSGVVLDGYLSNAHVFLDLNGNGVYDSGEPEATTNSSGNYTINATSSQLASSSIVVNAIAGTTIDQSNPGVPLTSGYVLTTPVGNTTVSPLTTQVAAKVASGMSVSAATTSVQTELGLTGVNVLSDYVASGSSAAQNTAAAIATVLQSVEAQSASNTSLMSKLSSLRSNVTANIIPNLNTIKNAATPILAASTLSSITQNSPTYSVGGSISGLTGTGLVLSDGSQNSYPNPGSTTFTFSSLKSSGNTYHVTVTQQPTNQICSVSNGSGAITNQSITNISIVCTASSGLLGGTISGLSTTGLSLTDTVEILPIASGSNNFTFNTMINSGTSYGVSIATQPIGLTCTISNASGIMSSNGISNVSVNCSPISYSVGGSISGLNASGLILQNGSDTISIGSGNNSFTLPTALAYGGNYSVSIASQPSGESCSIANSNGTIVGSNISSVAVTCAPIPLYSISGVVNHSSCLTNSNTQCSGDLILSLGSQIFQFANLGGQGSPLNFNFPNAVAAGGSYQILATTKPINTDCTFTNASGANVNSNISNVVITCSQVKGSLDVTVSGLNNSSSVSYSGSSNGITFARTVYTGLNNLPVTNDDADNLPAGASYTIQITTNPSGQTCTFSSNGQATLNGFVQPSFNPVGISCQTIPSCQSSSGSLGGNSITVNVCNGSGTIRFN